VAKSANLIAVQVFSRFDSTAWCGGSAPCALTWSSDQILGLQRVYALRGTYNIDAVNMSLGGGSYASQTTCDTDNAAVKAAIDNLRSVNIATVIASGNSGYTTSMGAPGCISSAVSVGATLDTVDSVDSYSNSVSYLNLLAPGSGITSAVPSSSYSTWNGTSMATPHVAGAWAILRQKAPTATVSEVLAALTSSGVAVTDSRNSVVKPRINLPAALTALVPGISYALNVSKAGTGTGSVTSSPEGIDCGSTCRANFSNGTVAVLNPVATDTNLFTGWSGACSGTGACSITMNATKDVTANFFLGTANTPINQSNLAGATGSSAYYSFSVPAGASNLVISISGGTGDVDLYVRASAQPTTSVFDCAPYESGNEETCAFATPLATSYYILLAGYSAFSGVTLTATYTTATPYSAGTLGFTTPTTTIRESTVNAVIIVTRSNGSDGAASVSYSTIAGTALAGMDYTPVAGSLAWGSGDSSSRSFNIPIINNAIRNQKSRGFTVNLASAAGASLGFTTSMTVNILDDDVITMPWLNLLLLDD